MTLTRAQKINAAEDKEGKLKAALGRADLLVVKTANSPANTGVSPAIALLVAMMDVGLL